MNWFDNFCAESRSKFFTKVPINLGDNLISADECYSLIKKNIKRSENETDDILWKIPIILITLGCSLVVLMAVSVALQCLLTKLMRLRTSEDSDSDDCIIEEQKKDSPKPKKKCSPKTKKICSCCSK
ncbi:hypothetical protein KR054_011170 [Drosophila jambulina]|nr:hypothetical protein KR054_011170 [Drosophila jambulina]